MLRRPARVLGLGLLSISTLWAGASAASGPREHLDRLRAQSPSVRAVWRTGRVAPSLVTGLRLETTGNDPESRARAFLAEHAPLVVGVDVAHLATETSARRTIVRFEQRHAGLPVFGRTVAVTLDAKGRVLTLNSDARPITHFDAATIDEAAARRIAVAHVLGDAVSPQDAKAIVRRGVVALGTRGTEVFEVEMSRRPLAEVLVVRVDAHAGGVLNVRNRVLQ